MSSCVSERGHQRHRHRLARSARPTRFASSSLRSRKVRSPSTGTSPFTAAAEARARAAGHHHAGHLAAAEGLLAELEALLVQRRARLRQGLHVPGLQGLDGVRRRRTGLREGPGAQLLHQRAKLVGVNVLQRREVHQGLGGSGWHGCGLECAAPRRCGPLLSRRSVACSSQGPADERHGQQRGWPAPRRWPGAVACIAFRNTEGRRHEGAGHRRRGLHRQRRRRGAAARGRRGRGLRQPVQGPPRRGARRGAFLEGDLLDEDTLRGTAARARRSTPWCTWPPPRWSASP